MCSFHNVIHITTENVIYHDGALEMLKIHTTNLSSILKVLCGWSYIGKNFANAIMELLNAVV